MSVRRRRAPCDVGLAARHPAVLAVWTGACKLGWAIALLWGLAAVVRAARDRARRRPALASGLVLFGCATAWAMFQLNKNAYESALYLPVAVVAVLLAWSASSREPRFAGPVLAALAVISTASQLLLLSAYAPSLLRAAHGGYLDGQRFSLSAYSYPRARIIAAGARCGLAPEQRPRRVLIDDLTYFAYARTWRPFHRLGVLEQWNGSIRDPAAWLHAHGSPGAVLACDYLPTGLRSRAVRTGAFCCLATG